MEQLEPLRSVCFESRWATLGLRVACLISKGRGPGKFLFPVPRGYICSGTLDWGRHISCLGGLAFPSRMEVSSRERGESSSEGESPRSLSSWPSMPISIVATSVAIAGPLSSFTRELFLILRAWTVVHVADRGSDNGAPAAGRSCNFRRNEFPPTHTGALPSYSRASRSRFCIIKR